MEIIIAILLLCLVLAIPNAADMLVGLAGLAVMLALGGVALMAVIWIVAALA